MSLVRRAAILLIFISGFSPVAGRAETAVPTLPACIKQPYGIVSHPIPPYPAASQRTGEQGNLLMLATIQPDGAVSDLKVTTSSGYDRLDRAAANYIKANWRWVPFDSACAESVTRLLSFNWSFGSSPEEIARIAPKVPQVTMTQADYPPAALAAREQSSAMVQAILASDNTLSDLAIVTSSGYPDLDAKTLEIAPDKIRAVWSPVLPKPVEGKLSTTAVKLSVHWTLKQAAASADAPH